jgi:hypothetical protein
VPSFASIRLMTPYALSNAPITDNRHDNSHHAREMVLGMSGPNLASPAGLAQQRWWLTSCQAAILILRQPRQLPDPIQTTNHERPADAPPPQDSQ